MAYQDIILSIKIIIDITIIVESSVLTVIL